MNETLNRDFSVLTFENKKKVVEMTKFLVMAQNTVIPEMLNNEKIPSKPGNEKNGLV